MQQIDDPPSLPVGTEVSAKYKGAFCEAKVKKVVRNIKVKVAYKHGLGSGIVPDDAIKSGTLRVGATVEVKHPDKKELVEATVTKIQDTSQYTVVFDDGDITTLRRTALCLKSGRHFNESETLDQLPLTHPEHFGNPVVGGRRGRRRGALPDDSSSSEDDSEGKEVVNEVEEHIGKVVLIESTDTKKKDKEKWFPGLVVSPMAQQTARIRVKDEYLVRSFKDGRYYTVPKKETNEFLKESSTKQDSQAVQAAVKFLEDKVLPPHWDKDALFGLINNSSDDEGGEDADSDSSDDEPTEKKDHFVAQLYKYMDDRGTPLNTIPSIQNRDVDLYRLFRTVHKLGGYNRVTGQNQWKSITIRLGFNPVTISVTNLLKQAYKKFLQPYEEFHRKLGVSMIMMGGRSSERRTKGRSLVRANSVASPKPASTPTPSTGVASPQPNSLTDENENGDSQPPEPVPSTSAVVNAKAKRKSSVGSVTGASSGKVKTLVEKFEAKEDKIEKEKIEAEKKKEKEKIEKEKEKEREKVEKEREKVEKEKEKLEKIEKEKIEKEKEKEKEKEEKIDLEPAKKLPRKSTINSDDKKSTRKKKDNEPIPVTSTTVIDNDFPVEVGDKLKVYYHEKKVTYEAKVIEISVVQPGTPLYLVHYTGWNNRYDEWVQRERIAENLSNNNKNKKKMQEKKESRSSTDTPTKDRSAKSTPNTAPKRSNRGRSDSNPPRSLTPSSVTPLTTRTKSPAIIPIQKRSQRSHTNSTSRRTSNPLSDMSLPTDDSSSDSDEPISKKKPPKSEKKLRNKASADNPDTDSEVEEEEEEEMETEITNSNPTSNGSSKSGYDLNQIRSELKGFEEMKPSTPDSGSQEGSSEKTNTVYDFRVGDTEDPTASKSPLSLTKDEMTKSSTDMSSETESFGDVDDDSQSSDKTTALENMTEKLQQKMAVKKDEKDSSSIEKIIKESLEEKRQENLKIRSSLMKLEQVEVKIEEKKPTKFTLPEIKPSLQEQISIVMGTSNAKPSTLLSALKTPEKPSPSTSTTSISKGLDDNDIYEFKEEIKEPFDFELTRKSSPFGGDSEKLKRKILSPSPSPLISVKKEEDITPPPSVMKRKKHSPLKDLDMIPKIPKPVSKPPASSIKSNLNMNALHDELASAVQALSAAIQPELDLPDMKIEDETLPILQEEPLKVEPNVVALKIETEMDIKIRKLSELASEFRKHKMSKNKDANKEASIVEKLLEKVKNFKKGPSNKETVDIKEETVEEKDVKEEEPPVDEFWVEIKDPQLLTQEEIEQLDVLIKKQKSENRKKATIIAGYGDFLLEMPNKNNFTIIEKMENFLHRKSPVLEVISTLYSSPTAAIILKKELIELAPPVIPPAPPLPPPSVTVPVPEENSDSDSDSESRLIIEVNEPEDDKCKTSPVLPCNPVDVAAKTAIQTIEENKDITIVRVEKKDLEQSIIQPPPPPLLGMTTITPLVYQPVSGSSSPSAGRIFGLPTSIDFSDSGVKPIVDIAQISQDLIIKEKKNIAPMNPETSLHSLPAETSIRPYLKKEIEVHSDSSSNQHSDSMKMLLCEETIPGSPSPVVGKDIAADIKPLSGAVLHPIEANIKHVPMDIESSLDIVKHEISMTAINFNSPHESQDDSCEDIKARLDMDSDISPRKRRRGYPKVMMVNEDTPAKKKKVVPSGIRRTGSDSDADNSDNVPSRVMVGNMRPQNRPSQYNFLVNLDQSAHPNQRIDLLRKKIQELRKTYNMVKNELASIDRRRKKLRRREREKKQQQMQQQQTQQTPQQQPPQKV
ncbi:ARID4B family protein [Megaselia abdita]